MGRLNHSGVVEADSKGEPSLQNFRVLGACAVIVRVDVSHDGNVHLGLSKGQLVLEDDLQVGVVGIVIHVVLRGAGSVLGNESVGESVSGNSLGGGEV